MKIIIIGAGELGRLLASRLSTANHDVTIIDSSLKGVDELRDKLDVMMLGGNATDIQLMKQAGIERADMLLAVSGDQSSNVLACQIARHFGVQRIICRLYSMDIFDDGSGLTPGFFGITKAFSSPAECAVKVLDVLPSRIILEEVHLSHPEASIITIAIRENSPLAGQRIMDLSNTEALSLVRFAALVRNHQLMIPHGKTVLQPNDKLYIAGHRKDVQTFIDSVSPEPTSTRKLIIIAGATLLGKIIAESALSQGHEVRFVEASEEKGEALLAQLPSSCKVLHGSTTDEEVLHEAGIGKCDVFIGAEEDDENNILACILAKRLGADKVVTITHKPEYISIVPAMDIIDCGFNSTLVSANAIFKLMETGNFRIDSRLLASQAYMTEFTVKPNSRLCGKQVMDCKLPQDVMLAMLFRGTDILAPSGKTRLQSGDILVAVVTPSTESKIKALFD